MFDIGFSELMVIGVVALLVIGPKDLPRVAKTIGNLLGRAQRYVNDVKSDINRQMELEELKRLQSEVKQAAQGVEDQVRGIQQELHQASSSFESSLSSSYDPGSDSATSYDSGHRDWAAEAHARRVRNRVQERLKKRRPKRASGY